MAALSPTLTRRRSSRLRWDRIAAITFCTAFWGAVFYAIGRF